MSKNKNKSISKLVWIGIVTFLGLLIFLFVHSITQSMEEKIDKEKVELAEKELTTKQEVQQLLSKMIEENKIYDGYARTYKEKLTGNDINGAQEAAAQAYEQARKLEEYYSTLKVPVEVPEHVLTQFEGLESDLSVAFGVRAEAFELVLAYLISDDTSHLKQAEEKFTESDEYYSSGSENIGFIAKQMGITLE